MYSIDAHALKLQEEQTNTQNWYYISMHTNSYSKSQFSWYAVAYSQCVPQPPTDISLSSPHQPAEILPKYAHLRFSFLPLPCFFSLSSSLFFFFPSSLSWAPIKANWHSGQAGVRGKYLAFGWSPITEQKSQSYCPVLPVCRELLFLSN